MTETPPAAPAATPQAPPAPNPISTPAPEANPFHLDGWKEHDTLSQYEKQLGKFVTEDGKLDAIKLGESYVNLEKFKGGPPPTPLEFDAFAKGLAWPEELPEGVQLTDGMKETYLKAAHELGLQPEAAAKLMEPVLKQMGMDAAEAYNAHMAQGAADFQALTAEVEKSGKSLAEYLETAQTVARKLGFDLNPDDRSPEGVRELRTFNQLAKAINEDTLRGGGGSGGNVVGGHLAQANDMATNPANPFYEAYHKPDHPQHAEAMRRYDQHLFEATKQNPGMSLSVEGGAI